MGRLRRLATTRGRLLWQPYAAGILLVAAVTALGGTILAGVGSINLVMLYLLAVVMAGLWWGRGAAVLASLLGVLSFDYFFVPPHFSFAISDAQYVFTFAALLVVALVVGTLTGRLRDHAAVLRLREQETAALYAFSRSMVAAQNVTDIARALVSHVSNAFGLPASLLLRSPRTPGLQTIKSGFHLTDDELAAAMSALEYGQPTGLDNDPSPHASVACTPLRTAQDVVGVLVVRRSPDGDEPGPAQRRLLEALAAQAAVVVERAQLAEAAREAQLLVEAQRLHDALLHSISHALRTPLASIIGSLSTLSGPGEQQLDQATRSDLLETAREEAERLNGLVGNLLDMTRLESGHLRLTMDWYDLEDVIGAALGQTAGNLKGRPIQVLVAEGLPLVPLDQVLIVQVLDNLLNNAVKYSPPGSPISVNVRQVDEAVAVQVADRGVGIAPDECERVFEKFYRVERAGNPTGTGLGLAICKGIVEAHGGRIWMSPRAGGGAEITFTLPLQARDVELGD